MRSRVLLPFLMNFKNIFRRIDLKDIIPMHFLSRILLVQSQQ